MDDAYQLLNEMKKGLLCWYDFKKKARILYIGNRADSLADFFAAKEFNTDIDETREYLNPDFQENYAFQYDYVVAVGEIERGFCPREKLAGMKKLLKKNGVLLLGANNRLGVRYFCGDTDNFSGNSFDAVDNYIMLSPEQKNALEGKNYSKAELKKFLEEAGWENIQFYSVFPNLTIPQHIFLEGYTPNEELCLRLFPAYENNKNILMKEEFLYTDLIENGLFHTMANSFLIECSNEPIGTNVNHVTLALDRSRENAQVTIIRNNGKVEKIAIYDEAKEKYKIMIENAEDLKEHGIQVLDAQIIDEKYVTNYIDNDNAEMYLRKLAFEGQTDDFISEMDRFQKTIMQSSEWVEDGENGVILKRGYIDLLPLNCFVIEGEFVFYDQEFFERNYPANEIVFRLVDTIYNNDENLNHIIPMKFFCERYGLMEKLDLWKKMAGEFGANLRNEELLREYYGGHRAWKEIVLYNRYRINPRIRRIFPMINKIRGKRIVLCGGGKIGQQYDKLFVFENICEIVLWTDKNWSRLQNEAGTCVSLEHIKYVDYDYVVIAVLKEAVALDIRHELGRLGVDNDKILWGEPIRI